MAVRTASVLTGARWDVVEEDAIEAISSRDARPAC
jgi:hypothetical protein